MTHSRCELVGFRRRENVRLLKLKVPRRLIGQSVKVGANGIEVGWLHTMVYLVAHKQLVVLSDILVDFESNDPFLGECARGGVEGRKAILRGPVEASQSQTGTGSVISDWLRASGTLGVSKQTHHLLVQRQRGRLLDGHIVQDCGREGRAWNGGRDDVRQNEAQALGVKEEEGLVLDNGTAD